MIRFLLKAFFKKPGDLKSPEVRTKYSVFTGVLGIICNLFLFAVKLMVGTVMSSIAIISDAVNNLSDSGTSVVTIIGAKLSSKKPDKKHPFGHGRVEYISSLIVSFMIMLVGFELLKTSVMKIFVPQPITLNPVLTAILLVSIPVKLWMYSYNNYVGKMINSGVLLATAKDSVNDVFATSAVIVSTILGKALNLPWLDGVIGTAVSFVIMYSGFKISADTMGILMGAAPEKEVIASINEYLISAPGISGVHDLIVHDYGPGRRIASVHAEVPDDCDVVEIHELIDDLEKKIGAELGVEIVVHMDPVSVNCEKTAKIRDEVKKIVKSFDKRMNIHDFRMTDGVNNINLIFDVEVPLDTENTELLKEQIALKIKENDKRYSAVINVDFIYD